MGWFVFGIIFFLIAAGLFVSGVFASTERAVIDRGYRYNPNQPGKEPNPWKTWLKVIAVAPLILSAIFITVSGAREVPTRSVGIPVAFGKVGNNVYESGLHWFVPPWKNLAIVQDTIQTDNYDSSTNNCITVRLGGQQEGCADVSMQWRILPSAAPELYADYSSYGGDITQTVSNYVVLREVRTVLSKVLGDYNPIQDVLTSANSNGESQFSTFDPQILADMRADVGTEIDFINFNLQYINYDASTQARLNQIQQQLAATAIAEEQYATNVAQAKANAALNNSNLSPDVLVSQCLNIVATAEKDNYALPAGFNCLGGTSVSVLGK